MPYPDAIKDYPKSLQLIIKKFYNRIFLKNKNALVIVVGHTGSGKSYSILEFLVAWYLYLYGKEMPDEFIINHFKFRGVDFMDEMTKDNLPTGDAWCWDEAGIDAGNQDYSSYKNKAISWYAQTCRNQHQLVFFTLPTLGMLTPQVRKLLHYYFEAVAINYQKEMGIIKPLEMQYNTRADKIYYHRLSYPSSDGYVDEIELANIPKPSESLCKLYEVKKTKFTKQLNREIFDILNTIEKDKRTLLDNPDQVLEWVKDAIMHGSQNLKQVANYLGMTNARSLSRLGGFTLFVEAKKELEKEGKLPAIAKK